LLLELLQICKNYLILKMCLQNHHSSIHLLKMCYLFIHITSFLAGVPTPSLYRVHPCVLAFVDKEGILNCHKTS
jgi:hypothetical protein